MINEIQAKSILRKYKKIDSWFISAYAINLYRGCTHNCVYCDGRDDKYQVEGVFGRDVSVKSNAIELLRKELDPARKRKPFKNGYFIICGGVSDSYQPFENELQLCRQTLELFREFNHPVHILTKSTLVERDMELLLDINRNIGATVSFSFSTVDDELGKLLEPGVPLPSKRLALIKRIKEAGLNCGMFLMPVVPGITDSAEQIDASVEAASKAGADYAVFSGMTLKPGRQKDYFMNFLDNYRPELKSGYNKVYGSENSWGSPSLTYAAAVARRFDAAASRHALAKRIPSEIFESLVSRDELIILILEQLDWLMKLKNRESPYGYAAYSLTKNEKPVTEMTYKELTAMRGIGSFTARLILEIIETGSSAYYRKMLRG